MQGISVGELMQHGTGILGSGPLSMERAEEEYNSALSKMIGEQYELLPPESMDSTQSMIPLEQQVSPLFTIQHVLRTNSTTAKVLGIYYILDGAIYKSPTVRALMKSNVARTLNGLEDASDALSACARYEPSTGYTFNFSTDIDNPFEGDEEDILEMIKGGRRKRMRRILDNRRPGEHTEEEEEGIRASEAIDRILIRLNKRTFHSIPMNR